MRAAFTICANNYLASAKVLKESFTKHHPAIPFFIVLVDKNDPKVNYDDFNRESILFINDIVDIDINKLSLKFNIAELCTTVKPFIFQYFFKQNSQVVYLDPDIKIYAPLTECWDALQDYTFVITPHLMNAVDDGYKPNDLDVLRTGIFNLGFIGLSKGDELPGFLKWWGERLLVYGYTNWDKGMFYDQIWANYIPVMFNNYHILKHYGYNVANWNWHERLLEKNGNGWLINNKYPLVFFHFSNYKYAEPLFLCKYNNRYSRENRPDLVPIFDEYQSDLTAANAPFITKLSAYYQEQYQNQILKDNAAIPIIKKIKNRLIKYIDAVL
ncbi:hypothetical protein [Mucilaginibacter sp.]|jgi:hypothetical protein|uniref:hypothetical protein n=1 Tax=Mucilaginibacter sp. TaxID=1882438 RepID=UPI003567AC43